VVTYVGSGAAGVHNTALQDIGGRADSGCDGTGGERCSEMAENVVFEVLGLDEFGLEEVIGRKLTGVHQDRAENVGTNTTSER